jgi:hypothetical protein
MLTIAAASDRQLTLQGLYARAFVVWAALLGDVPIHVSPRSEANAL